MSYCTNAADDGRVFEFFGVHLIRDTLENPGMPEDEKDLLLRRERESVADYYNWLFDREQERKTNAKKTEIHGPAPQT